jgi:hypothetical protein
MADHSIEELKRVLVIDAAYMAVAQAKDAGRWVVRRNGELALPTD